MESPPAEAWRARLDGGLDIVGEIVEKVKTSKMFEVVDRAELHVGPLLPGSVADDKSNSLGLRAEPQHGLEESLGYGDATVTDGLVLLTGEERTADYEDLAILACPGATIHLETVPDTGIAVIILRADIGEQEGLIHGNAAPLVVASGAHVTAVPAAGAVVIERGTWPRNLLILMEGGLGALSGAVSMVGRETPGDPIGLEGGLVVGDCVGRSAKDLLWTGGRWCRKFERRGYLDRVREAESSREQKSGEEENAMHGHHKRVSMNALRKLTGSAMSLKLSREPPEPTISTVP